MINAEGVRIALGLGFVYMRFSVWLYGSGVGVHDIATRFQVRRQ